MKKNKKIKYLVGGLVVLATLVFALKTWAATPSQYGLTEGNTISAAGSNDPDIYIVNDLGYKRLFLNPVIFGFYGHLGGFANVKTVTSEVRDAFMTSGLFRVDGSEKVYGLESTGEDTGVLHWVNTTGAQAVADDVDFFKKVFVINQNEFNWYSKGTDYTSVSQIPNYSRNVVETVVNKAVANVIASQTVTRNAQGFPILDVSFNGNGSVNTLIVKRLGFGSNTDYQDVYLTKNGVRLTNPKSFTSNNDITFSGLNLTAPFTLQVVADFNGTPQNIAKVELQGEYNGLPLQSNSFTFAGATSGNVTIDNSGSADTLVIGQKNAKVGEFKVTAGDEDLTLKKLYLSNFGSADISNVKLVVDEVTYNSSLVDNKYSFNLNTVIKTTKNKKFEVFADIDSNAKNTENVKIRLDQDYDLVAIGNVYGFGLTVVNNFSGNTYSIVDSGNLTVSAVTNDNVVALWNTNKQLFQFKVKATDENFNLNELGFSVNPNLVKKLYVYQDSTLVGSEDIDGNTATVSADYVLSGEKTFTVKADFVKQDTLASGSFTPSLIAIKARGVGSDKEVTVNTTVNGSVVYVYSAYPVVTRTDSFSSSMPLADTDVLKLSVTAVGGDIKLASASAAFAFTVNSYGMPNNIPYKVLVGGLEYSNDVLASTSNTFTPFLSRSGEELFIAEGATKEITFQFNFSGADANRGFKLTLPNSNSIMWFSKDKDGNFVTNSSSTDTFNLPIVSTQFYREN